MSALCGHISLNFCSQFQCILLERIRPVLCVQRQAADYFDIVFSNGRTGVQFWFILFFWYSHLHPN